MMEREERPWGWFEILHEESGLKLKRIVVKPRMRLSLQSHKSRSENWVVLEGHAVVTVGKGKIHVFPTHAVFIPQGAKHRVENTGESNLVIIEVQSGSYLGEDDIIRYEDDFNRV